MPPRSVQIRFHSIAASPTNRPILLRLIIMISQANEAERQIPIDGRFLSFVPHPIQQGHFLGLTKERKIWPHWMSFAGGVNEISSTEDGTIGETSYFWILPEQGLMIEAYNQRGASPVSLRKFIRRWGRLHRVPLSAIEFLPIMNSSAYAQFLGLLSVSKIDFHFNVSAPGAELIDNTIGDEMVGSSLRTLGQLSAVTFSGSISMGHRGGSLTIGRLRGLVEALHDNEHVDALQVHGIVPDTERPSVIDLEGSKRLKFDANINVEDRYADPSDVQSAMHRAFQHNQTYLQNFGWRDEL